MATIKLVPCQERTEYNPERDGHSGGETFVRICSARSQERTKGASLVLVDGEVVAYIYRWETGKNPWMMVRAVAGKPGCREGEYRIGAAWTPRASRQECLAAVKKWLTIWRQQDAHERLLVHYCTNEPATEEAAREAYDDWEDALDLEAS